jgi:glycosyltransferase involved in cell wall biosynthesis
MNQPAPPSSAPAVPHFLSSTVVTIPALNEAACVALTISAWLDLGAGKIRVVDNGSTDATADAARKAGAEVLIEPRRGYGAAAWRGLQDWPSAMTWVLFSSADGSDKLSKEEAREWQAAIDAGADLIIGDRVSVRESRAELKWIQRLGNWITCQAIRLGWGRRFNDMGSLRLARHNALISLGLEDRGFGWNVEMQIRALQRGWKIVELPVRYFPRHAGESKISGNLAGTCRAGRGILRMLALLWMLRRKKPNSIYAAHQADSR